jgi:hypothetical protein
LRARQKLAVAQDTALTGWVASTGADGADHGDGVVVELELEVVVVVVVGRLVVETDRGEPPPPQPAASATVTTRVTAAVEERLHLVVKRSTGHCPTGAQPHCALSSLL